MKIVEASIVVLGLIASAGCSSTDTSSEEISSSEQLEVFPPILDGAVEAPPVLRNLGTPPGAGIDLKLLEVWYCFSSVTFYVSRASDSASLATWTEPYRGGSRVRSDLRLSQLVRTKPANHVRVTAWCGPKLARNTLEISIAPDVGFVDDDATKVEVSNCEGLADVSVGRSLSGPGSPWEHWEGSGPANANGIAIVSHPLAPCRSGWGPLGATARCAGVEGRSLPGAYDCPQ
jgi:hypothetical protein